MGRLLWREKFSVVYTCCSLSSAQSFSGRSPIRLMTIFSLLRLETPPAWTGPSPRIWFPQEHGGTVLLSGIGVIFLRILRLRTLRLRYWKPSRCKDNGFQSMSQSYVTSDGQSVSMSWCQTSIWGLWPDFITVSPLWVCWLKRHLLLEDEYVVYNCCWSSLAHSLLVLSPEGI
jgi:hypothetical protein